MRFIALVPARSGSKRILDKNIQVIGGQSLLQRSILVSKKCDLISHTFIVTDSTAYEKHAVDIGAVSVGLRPPDTSLDYSPDILWVKWILNKVIKCFPDSTHYIILRPTTPFRTRHFLDSAINKYIACNPSAHTTLRCVSRVKEHPFKMWTELPFERMSRLFPFQQEGVFLSDQQSSLFPNVFVQNAALEIGAIEHILVSTTTSSADTIMFEWSGIESFDINTPSDLEYASFLASKYGL